MNQQDSAQHASLTNLVVVTNSVCDLSQSRDLSCFKGLSSSQGLLGFQNGLSFCSPGEGGELLEQYLGISEPLRV